MAIIKPISLTGAPAMPRASSPDRSFHAGGFALPVVLGAPVIAEATALILWRAAGVDTASLFLLLCATCAVVLYGGRRSGLLAAAVCVVLAAADLMLQTSALATAGWPQLFDFAVFMVAEAAVVVAAAPETSPERSACAATANEFNTSESQSRTQLLGMIANLSREIRTSLNDVIGMGRLLMETAIGEEQRELAQGVCSGAAAILIAVNSFLDFSELSERELRFEAFDFDLRTTLEDVVELMAHKASNRKCELALLIDGDVPTALRGDPGRISQVLSALIGAAIKLTLRGDIMVRASKQNESPGEVEVRFEINSSGARLTPQALAHLRRILSCATSPEAPVDKNVTAPEVVLAARLIARMHGAATVEAQEMGLDIQFTARLDKQPNMARQPALVQPDLRGKRILIADGNVAARQMLRQQLAALGASVDSATEATETLTAIRQQALIDPYAAAIVDGEFFVAGHSGLIGAIRSDPALAGIALVISVPRGALSENLREKTAAADGWLIKPIKQAELWRCLAGLTMKAPQEAPGVTAAKMGSGRAATTPSPRPDVLVVDDNAVNSRLTVLFLKKLGYSAATVDNGRDAIAALELAPYPIVLMDVEMSDINGFEATAAIRKQDSGRQHPVIVATTANALPGDRERCLAAGMDDYLSKPVKLEDLSATLARWTTRAGLPLPGSIQPPPAAVFKRA